MLLLAGAIAWGVHSCAGTPESRFEDHVSGEPVSGGTDRYLVKAGIGGPARVALIYGMYDDERFCNELAHLYMKQYPADTYYCEPAQE